MGLSVIPWWRAAQRAPKPSITKAFAVSRSRENSMQQDAPTEAGHARVTIDGNRLRAMSVTASMLYWRLIISAITLPWPAMRKRLSIGCAGSALCQTGQPTQLSTRSFFFLVLQTKKNEVRLCRAYKKQRRHCPALTEQ